jgi:hypothetical protein
VEPEHRLGVTVRHLYQDAQGRWFDDPDARLSPVIRKSDGWPWWGVAGGVTAAALATGVWALRRRRRRR